jgi:5-methylthioadenosine/S-adenosylhomocysteine deaminase
MAVLTNAHTHLELGWLADQCPDEAGREYIPWMMQVGEERRKLGAMACFVETKFRQAVEAGLQALLDAGTTHIGDVSASGSSIHPLFASGLQGVVYVEVTGQYPEQADRALAMAKYVIDEARPKERNGMRVGLAINSPWTVHPTLWKKAIAYVGAESLPVCIHIAESEAEYDWMLNDSGPGADMHREQGISLSSPRKTPIAFLEDLGALALKPLLVHGVQVSEADVKRIAASGSRVVHCPRSNTRLQCGRMPLEVYLKHGVPVYLGTESLASSPSLDVREEAAVAVELHEGRFTRKTIKAMLEQPLTTD